MHHILKLHDKIPSHITIHLFVGSFTRLNTFFFPLDFSVTQPFFLPLYACFSRHVHPVTSWFNVERFHVYSNFSCMFFFVACVLLFDVCIRLVRSYTLLVEHDKRTNGIALVSVSVSLCLTFSVCVQCVAPKSNRVSFSKLPARHAILSLCWCVLCAQQRLLMIAYISIFSVLHVYSIFFSLSLHTSNVCEMRPEFRQWEKAMGCLVCLVVTTLAALESWPSQSGKKHVVNWNENESFVWAASKRNQGRKIEICQVVRRKKNAFHSAHLTFNESCACACTFKPLYSISFLSLSLSPPICSRCLLFTSLAGAKFGCLSLSQWDFHHDHTKLPPNWSYTDFKAHTSYLSLT